MSLLSATATPGLSDGIEGNYLPVILPFKIPFLGQQHESLVIPDKYRLELSSDLTVAKDGTYILPARASFKLSPEAPVLRFNLAYYQGVVPPYTATLYRDKLVVSRSKLVFNNSFAGNASYPYWPGGVPVVQEIRSTDDIIVMPPDLHTIISVSPGDLPYSVDWATNTIMFSSFSGPPTEKIIKYRVGVIVKQGV